MSIRRCKFKTEGNILSVPVLIVFCFLLAYPAPAYAHPDFKVAEDTFQVAPRGYLEIPLLVHFHRVVGTFEVISPSGETVNVLLMDGQAFSRFVAGQPALEFYSSGTITYGKVNFLLGCCVRSGLTQSGENSQELTYTKHLLVIDNRDSASTKFIKLR